MVLGGSETLACNDFCATVGCFVVCVTTGAGLGFGCPKLSNGLRR